jgi:hypothetical protein
MFYCTHAALPHLVASGESWIINIGSLAGKNAFPGGAAYNASKFGLIGFSEALMQEVRHDGVRVSYIMPGSVATEFSHPSGRGDDDWKVQPEDIAQHRPGPAGHARTHAAEPGGGPPVEAAQEVDGRDGIPRTTHQSREPRDGHENREGLAGRDAGARRRAVRRADPARRRELPHQRPAVSRARSSRRSGMIKKAAAETNAELGLLDAGVADAIVDAAGRGGPRRP